MTDDLNPLAATDMREVLESLVGFGCLSQHMADRFNADIAALQPTPVAWLLTNQDGGRRIVFGRDAGTPMADEEATPITLEHDSGDTYALIPGAVWRRRVRP